MKKVLLPLIAVVLLTAAHQGNRATLEKLLGSFLIYGHSSAKIESKAPFIRVWLRTQEVVGRNARLAQNRPQCSFRHIPGMIRNGRVAFRRGIEPDFMAACGQRSALGNQAGKIIRRGQKITFRLPGDGVAVAARVGAAHEGSGFGIDAHRLHAARSEERRVGKECRL